MEIWKSIENFERYYEVSNLGRVRSLDRSVKSAIVHNESVMRRSRVLKTNKKRNGYLSVVLSKECKPTTVTVHKLVATAFIDKPKQDKLQVNHKNLDKTDNRVTNLEWCDSFANQRHARQMKPWSSYTKRIVCVELRKEFPSSYQAAQWLNETYFGHSKSIVTMSHKIRYVCRGEKEIAFGFHWKDISA